MRVGYKYQNKIDSLTRKIRKKVADNKGGRVNSDSYNEELKRMQKELRRISKEAKQALKRAN